MIAIQHSTTIPQQGQIATVRQRRYVVTDIAPSTLPVSPMVSAMVSIQHLVSLNCIEDDGLGESLQVIWEMEPGARVEEKIGLPTLTGFDPPQTFDAFLNAVRWGAISAADDRTLQAPFRSGIDIEDYQLDPLVRAVQMPRVNLLIADDVGLGKTIETGLIIQELLTRNRARNVLIVCPASIQLQWQTQMREKFGLEFRIVDTALMRDLRRKRGRLANPWTHFPRLITSVDFIKRDRPLDRLREALPAQRKYPRPFDLLVVDEAHNIAPSGRGKYAIDSQRTRAIRLLTPHFEHKLFLSATPHNGYKESFSALLELLDDQRFARGFDPDRKQLQAVMVRRLKSELKDWDGTARFPKRDVQQLDVTFTDDEKQVHAWLAQYAQKRRAKARDPFERYVAEFVLKLLKKRLLSSPAAFARTLEQHFKTVTSRNRPASGAPRESLAGMQQQLGVVDDDYADDEAYEDTVEETVSTASAVFSALEDDEHELLRKMRGWADVHARNADSKADRLIEWLKDTVRPGGNWNHERVIIFTEYRDTQKWLYELLAAQGLTRGDRTAMLFGGMDGDEREQIKAAFQANPADSEVRILLATDAASEGIDLQNHCHRLVHMEIPWNPNRMEQRNGRVDRHGQKQDVLIYHFASAGFAKTNTNVPASELDADLEFLMRAVQKVEQIREDLGKVGPVIAEQVERAMLGGARRLNTDAAEQDGQPVRAMLKFERDLRKQIDAQMEQLNETRQSLNLSPENIERVVNTALKLARQPALIPLGNGLFRLPALSDAWARCAEGLPHPYTHEIRPITFEHALAKGRDDVVLVHLNHRLVDMALRLLRAEVWSPLSQHSLHRITIRQVRENVLTAPAIVAHARLVVIGDNSYRLHEEVIMAGGHIREGRFRRMNVGETRSAMEAATETVPDEAMQQRLTTLWHEAGLGDALMQALEARARERVDGMRKLLEERAFRERGSIEITMRELMRSIERELKQSATTRTMQLELFGNAERDQYRSNQDALRIRLGQIPGEIEQEVAAIDAHYSDPQPRMFPAAITFLVPDKLS